jgi:hypothetical protein
MSSVKPDAMLTCTKPIATHTHHATSSFHVILPAQSMGCSSSVSVVDSLQLPALSVINEFQ